MKSVRKYVMCLSMLLFIATVLFGGGYVAFGAACRDYNGNDNGHLISFVNNSNEQVVIGVFGSVFNSSDARAVPDAGYAHPQNWVLDAAAGSMLTWCVPGHFNGRFFARTGCDVTGKCLTGDCCKAGSSCTGNVCTKTAAPASLAEMFVDSQQGTYYDISFVDGYDFPLMLKPVIPARQTLNSLSPGLIDASADSFDFNYDATATISLKISNYSDDNLTVTNATAADFDSQRAISSNQSTGDVTISYKNTSIILAGLSVGKSVTTVNEFNSLAVGVIRFGVPSPVNTGVCSETGCKNPPKCQWGWLADGVCLSPYKMFEIQYPDFRYRPEYYPLAAMCTKNQFLQEGEAACCGCGKTKDCNLAACPTQVTVPNPYNGGSNVTLNSSGCSPINHNYNLPGEGNGTEEDQITCNPTTNDTKTYYGTACNPWDAFYKAYTTTIINTCGPDVDGKTVKSVYTWQYDDDHGLLQCGNDNAMGFKLTILPRDTSLPKKNMITFTPGYAKDNITPLTGTITVNSSTEKLTFVGPDSVILPVLENDTVAVSMNCSLPGFSTTCNLTYKGPATGFVVDPTTSSPVCSDATIFTDWGKSLISLAYPDDTWCSSSGQFRLQISPAATVVGYVCAGSSAAASFSPSANPPITVYLKDKDSFRLVQNCGADKQGKNRVIDCTADFSMTQGFTPKTVDGASGVCTDNRINWKDAFVGNNIGLGVWNVDVDCVAGEYVEQCTAAYTAQDSKAALQFHINQPVTHSNPLKLDHNNDNKINMIDAIMLLRRSMGL